MNQKEEDALIAAGYKAIEGAHYSELVTVINDALRTAIRAGVAHERERAAKCCDREKLQTTFGDWGVGHDKACEFIAAAIRRGE